MWELLFLGSFHGTKGPSELLLLHKKLPSPHGWEALAEARATLEDTVSTSVEDGQ